MGKFQLIRSQETAGSGFRLKILDRKANLQDLLDEVNLFIENASLPRLWPSGSNTCMGCHLCCHEPLPVTIIDVLNICMALSIDLIRAHSYLTVHVQGNVVDIILKRKKGSCIFLNPQGKCRIYEKRPFLCQTYLCCHTTSEYEELRSQVVNQGMDELVRMSLQAFKATGQDIPVARGSSREVRLQDWMPNQFSNKNDYQQILLENVLSSALMQVLLV